MFHVNVWLSVKDAADTVLIRDNLAAMVAGSRAEPGCVRYDAFQSQANTQKFLLVECWADRAAWEVHRTAAAFKTIYEPIVLPRVDREPHISTPIE